MNSGQVIGRFAPSPTGDLHFGSLVSAVGSFLEARTAGGAWLIRVEDIDPPREVAGSADRIIRELRRLGLEPDGPVLYQSSRLEAYEEAMNRLFDDGLAYHCACTRKNLPASGIYPGTCRDGIEAGKEARSVRFRVEQGSCVFTDKLQGEISDSPADIGGDFIIRRADGLFAYQLAVVVDDHYQSISQVVRGADLLDSTSRQIRLQDALGFNSPDYMHLPVAVGTDGRKLSKQFKSDPLTNRDPAYAVCQALRFLGQNPPPNLSLGGLWNWALERWNKELIPRCRAIQIGPEHADSDH